MRWIYCVVISILYSSFKTESTALKHILSVLCEQVLGEYFSLVTDVDPEVILTKLHGLLKKTFVTSETKAWIMAAVTKIASHTSCSKAVDEIIQELSSSLDTCLRQYAFELKHLCEDKALMKSCLPFDASCSDLVVRHIPGSFS